MKVNPIPYPNGATNVIQIAESQQESYNHPSPFTELNESESISPGNPALLMQRYSPKGGFSHKEMPTRRQIVSTNPPTSTWNSRRSNGAMVTTEGRIEKSYDKTLNPNIDHNLIE
jgi:hypothetical protein